jgi:hypothetical protein
LLEHLTILDLNSPRAAIGVTGVMRYEDECRAPRVMQVE